MFPLAAAGAVRAASNSMTANIVMQELAERLARQKPTLLSLREGTLIVEGGPFRFVGNTNLLVVISGATIIFSKNGDEITLSYHLRFHELVIAGSLMTSIVGYVPLTQWGTLGLGVFVMFWLWFVGGNYLLSAHRFRGFLRKTLQDVACRSAAAAKDA